MDWNKKNLLRVGDYFHSKLKDLISEARLSLNEKEKKALGILDQISPSGLLHVVRFYPQFNNWGNFLKENNCEQYDKNDFWVIFSKMATRQLPDSVIVPLYKDRERDGFDAAMPWTEPDSLILCPKDFAEKILKLESFGG